jgi:hypothetical protein
MLTHSLLMVRPAAFAFNAETAKNNFFQNKPVDPVQLLQLKALKEFDIMADILTRHGIEVLIADDDPEPPKPDAVFPNNWFSTNKDGVVIIYPMYAESRRIEKRNDIIEKLAHLYHVKDVWDWTEYEKQNMFLEGTGSMVIDHAHEIVYASESPRTNLALVKKFASEYNYKTMCFSALDRYDNAIYHTNVMMCVGEGFAVLCSEIIKDESERKTVVEMLRNTDHEIIFITEHQMKSFAGNMLHLKNKEEQKFIVLSTTAFRSLEQEKIEKLEHYGMLLPIDVPTIERVEGGSVRCMMAEIFLPAKN